MSAQMIESQKTMSLKDFKRKRLGGQIGPASASEAAPQSAPVVSPDDDDGKAAALARSFFLLLSLAGKIAKAGASDLEKAEMLCDLGDLIDSHLREVREIPDAILERHGLKRKPDGFIDLGEGK